MQVLLQLPDGVDDVAIADVAASRGIAIRSLSPLHLTPNRQRGLLLGYGRLSEIKIEDAATALSAIVIEAGATISRPTKSSHARLFDQ
jgi:GntR family transcriptional regulator/MocR family aminotransferase